MSNLAILCDEQGNAIGQKDRHELVAGDSIQIASLWIENSKGEVLLAQRAHEKRHDPGLWSSAAAGTIEPGETFESNVMKEAEEEIGLIGIQPQEHIRWHWWRKDGTGRYATIFTAVVDWPIEKFTLQTEEVANIRWIKKDDLRVLIKQHPEQFVENAQIWDSLLGLL